jgi:sulfite exporter TauE/SafE
VETGELFGFILAGILLYLSALDIIAVIVLIVVGLYHLGGALSTKQNLLEFSQEKLRRFLTVIMIVCFAEVAVAGSIVVWMASNGWISL